jgi:nucleoside triphosphate pyrophosphatase
VAQFVLASTSPRRVDLLRLAGYDFTTQKSGFSEVVHRHPKSTVEANARGKATAVASGVSNQVVLAADTIVYLPEPEGVTLGQAKSQDDVRRMLGLLEGRAHEVYSGVAVACGDNVSVRAAMTRVRLGELTETEISAYVKLGEGVGKAGGYAIQGRAALFVEGIEGEYTNVVGLPLTLASSMLEDYGIRWY